MSIEDPYDQDDWDSYATLTAKIGEKAQIVGDDLLVTNPARIAGLSCTRFFFYDYLLCVEFACFEVGEEKGKANANLTLYWILDSFQFSLDGVAKKACNALLLKVNQIGSVTEALDAALAARAAGWTVMVSHRSYVLYREGSAFLPFAFF